MKLNISEMQQLCYYKKLLATNRLDALILPQQEPYPPPEYTANQIYCSQYATAVRIIKNEGINTLDNQKNSQYKLNEKVKPQTSSKKRLKYQAQYLAAIKYPFPLAFAYFEAYMNDKQYDKAITVLSQRLQRKNVSNTFIINYNLSHLYQQKQDSKRAIFYLQSALKYKPFMIEAILDYSFLLSVNNRTFQALQMLKRHLGYSNLVNTSAFLLLGDNPQIQSMLLNLAYQSKSTFQQKQIVKIFNNKTLTIQTSFNLGLYFKKIWSLQKAQQLFEEIIRKLDQGFQEIQKNDSFFIFKEKDQKIYFYSKINAYQIYEQLIVKKCHITQNNRQIELQINQLRLKIYHLLKSLIQNEEKANKKYPVFYKKYFNFLQQKVTQTQKNLNKEIQFIYEEKDNDELPSVKYLSTEKKTSNPTELKKIKSKPIFNQTFRVSSISKRNLHSSMTGQTEREEMGLIKQFHKKFQQRRLENEKKLKFLLLKDKQLDNFFNTLPKINFDQQKKNNQNESTFQGVNMSVQHKKIIPNSIKVTQQSFNQVNQSKFRFIPPQKNKTLINKLKKQLQQNNDLSKYEQEFQRKKLKYQQQFSGYNIDQAVSNIMGKIFQGQKQKKIPQKQKQIKIQNVTITKVKQSIKQNQQDGIQEQLEIKNINTFQKFQQQKISKQVVKQSKISPYEQKKQTRKGSRKVTQILDNRDNIENILESKSSSKNIKRSTSNSSKNFRIKLSVNTQDQFQIENKKKQSIIEAIKKNKKEIEKSNQLEAPQIKVNQIDYDQQSANLNVSFNKKFSDLIVQDDNLLEERNKLKKNTFSDKNSMLESSTSLLTTHKIFVEKQRNNIQDIFEAFNPGSNRNILINQNAPTSRQQSKKTTGVQQNSTSLNHLDTQYQESASNLPLQFRQKYDRAAQLQNQGHYSEAFEIYTQLYKKFKSDDLKQMILLGIAFNFQLQYQFEQAQKTYLKCSKYNNAEAFMKLGQLLIRHNRIQDGIQNLQKANCITRFNMQIQTKLVYAYSLKQETIEKALSLAQSILKRQPMSLQILIMTAKILQKQEKISDALQVCLAINSFKESEFIKHYIGTLYMSQGNVVEAFKYFKNALTLNSNHVPSLIEIGTILSEMKPKQAVSILNRALEIQPTNRFALTRLAKIYESIEQDPNKAMEIYRKTLETKLNYEAYMKIADCQSINGSYMEALMNYRQALNLKKTHTAYRKIAEMHEFKKEYKKSVENYQLALQTIPNEHKFYEEKKQIMVQMAKDLLLLQQYETAITTLEQLLQTQESKEIYDMLGQAYFGKQEYSIALQFYQKANNIESEQQDPQLLEKIALCFDKKQQFTASKKIYEKILSINPSNISCMNNYANILLILGDTNEAFYWYQVMLQNTPKNIQKRLKVSDIYSSVGDWSKVQYHLLFCYKLKQHDSRVLEKLINLYKEKRQQKMVAKYQKKLVLLKGHNKKKQS